MRELVEMIAKALVDSPDQVEVSQSDEDAERTVLEVRVAPEDLGKVIGKRGRTARALRTILSASGVKLGRRLELRIVD